MVSPTGTAPTLRRLYFVRFAFAVVWAATVAATAMTSSPFTVALFVVYPVFDVVAAVIDARSATKPVLGLYVNMAISLLAGVGLALVASSGNTGILRVWGAWAITAGLVQLGVGVVRRALGGQWPMIISGGISVFAGASFVLQAKPGGSLVGLAGYAVLGGIFFLVSALRLGRAAKKN
jgi:uncharacterized membrane protein HdeD (DUF308 family)